MVNNWQELYNDNGRDDTNKVKSMCEITVSNYVYYDCEGEVELFREIPCSAEITTMTRYIVDYDNDGKILDKLELDYNDFPQDIVAAAEKKLVEEY